MRRIKKTIFLGFWGTALAVLGIVRACCPEVMKEEHESVALQALSVPVEAVEMHVSEQPAPQPAAVEDSAQRRYNRILSVPSFERGFPDLQDVQIQAARHWGVPPVANREQAEERKSELVYVGSNPYFAIDRGMTSSIPYLVPRAADLLQRIGRNYLDSLVVKGVPLHKIIVTSVLRTEEDVARLMRRNENASSQSCHRYGTTFDICYNRYQTVSPPGEERRAVTNDTLKWILAEVLRDVRKEERCYIKYEVKQGCFHITMR